jgi:tetratricopeptide (TPR) repeat protein
MMRGLRANFRGALLVGVALALVPPGAGPAAGGEGPPPGSTLPADVAGVLDQADRAFLAGDDAAAQASYARVLARAPDFRPALWGRAAALLRLGRDYEALHLLDAALGPDPGRSECLAAARLASGGGAGREAAARRFLERAAGRGPGPAGDDAAGAVEARALLARLDGDDRRALREWQALVARRPERYALVARPGPRPDRAPAADAAAEPGMLGGGDWERVQLILAACLAIGAAWAAGLGLLFACGDALARATLRRVDRAGPGLAIPRGYASVRRLYRAAIRWAAVYCYVSLAVVVGLITAVPACLVYGLATSPRVSGWAVLAGVPLGLVLFGVWAPLVRSLRVRLVETPEGRPLREAEAPALWALVREVAGVVGTRPVDEVRLVTGATVAVAERGRARDKRDGRSVRALVLGMATFDEFPAAAFRAVVAHEYAHLLHRDTSRPALAVRLAARLNMTLAWVAFWGGDAWWNVGWHFVSSYARFFRHIVRGADRLAEVHADRVAALAFGAGPAVEGLLHIIRRDAEHQESQGRAFLEALRPAPDWPETILRNDRAMRRRAVAARIRAELDAPGHADHTHPSPARRLELFRAMASERPDPEPAADDGAGLWPLLADPGQARDEFRRRCDAEVQAQLDAHAAMASQAVSAATAAILDHPGQPGHYIARAEVHFRTGDLPASIRDLDAALERAPASATARFARGQVRMRTGDLVGAADDLREAIRLARLDFEPAARAALGDLAAAAGDWVGAVADYGRAIGLDPTEPAIFLKRGRARLLLGDPARAATDFAAATELDADSAEAWVGLAEAREAEGDVRRALAAAERAVALDTGLPDGHILMARLLVRDGPGLVPDPPRAVDHARRAVALARGADADAEAALARALERGGDLAAGPVAAT